MLFPTSFRGELLQYLQGAQERRAVHRFESNRLRPYSTRRIRQIIHAYALAAGIQKRVYPHLFRHQIITLLTKKGIISPKLQLLSGHAEEKSLARIWTLALADVAAEYEAVMQSFGSGKGIYSSYRSWSCRYRYKGETRARHVVRQTNGRPLLLKSWLKTFMIVSGIAGKSLKERKGRSSMSLPRGR